MSSPKYLDRFFTAINSKQTPENLKLERSPSSSLKKRSLNQDALQLEDSIELQTQIKSLRQQIIHNQRDSQRKISQLITENVRLKTEAEELRLTNEKLEQNSTFLLDHDSKTSEKLSELQSENLKLNSKSDESRISVNSKFKHIVTSTVKCCQR